MFTRRILVAADDRDICHSIKACMQSESVNVCSLTSASEILNSFVKQEYCLVILDDQLPGISCKEILRTMRLAKHIPILLLIDSLTSDDKIALLQVGADAIIEKPLNIDLCVAQAEALIQLYSKADIGHNQKDQITFGSELVIIPRFRQVFIEGKPLSLTRKEFDLLHFFARYPRQVFSREQLYVRIWHDSFASSGDETVRVHIQKLRKKLEAEGKSFIHNVWGVGYKFVPADHI